MSDILSGIESLKGLGMKFGTQKTRLILDKLGSPDSKLKIVHIAGTNGKGSIAEYLTQILISSGERVGTFTSPAVIEYLDQIRVDGKNISGEAFDRYMQSALKVYDGQTEFEMLTAIALLAFYDMGCSYAVVECGLGGLNDATNAVLCKEIAIISSIGLEHTAVLGNTLKDICAQKAGIITDCPAVVNALQESEAREYFASLKVTFADKGLKIPNDDLFFEYDGETYEISMAGFAQVYNAATAVEAAHILGIDDYAIKVGLKKAYLPGRTQILHRGGNTYIVDGGHNPSALKPLAKLMKKYDDVTVIFGCLSDKDIDGDLKAISGFNRLIAVKPDSDRAMDIDKITETCKRYFKDVSVEQSVSEALKRSFGTIVVCGSFTLVKEALNWIEKE